MLDDKTISKLMSSVVIDFSFPENLRTIILNSIFASLTSDYPLDNLIYISALIESLNVHSDIKVSLIDSIQIIMDNLNQVFMTSIDNEALFATLPEITQARISNYLKDLPINTSELDIAYGIYSAIFPNINLTSKPIAVKMLKYLEDVIGEMLIQISMAESELEAELELEVEDSGEDILGEGKPSIENIILIPDGVDSQIKIHLQELITQAYCFKEPLMMLILLKNTLKKKLDTPNPSIKGIEINPDDLLVIYGEISRITDENMYNMTMSKEQYDYLYSDPDTEA